MKDASERSVIDGTTRLPVFIALGSRLAKDMMIWMTSRMSGECSMIYVVRCQKLLVS